MTIKARVRQGRFESEAQEAMVGLLVAAGHLQQALEEVCGAHGITHDQYNLLRVLRGRYPRGYPRYEVAARLISRAPDVTRLVDRLEKREYVERYRSEEDGRLSLARITEAGLGLLGELDDVVLAIHERFSSELTQEEVRDLTRLIDKVIPP